MDGPLFLAIDQGTTSTRTIAFDADWRIVAQADRRLGVQHPRPGWAEQDPDEILESVVITVVEVLGAVGGSSRVVAVGLDNQGETALAWDAETGRPFAPAILWSCRRSEEIVARLAADGRGPAVQERTGLPLDPYFSRSKPRQMRVGFGLGPSTRG
jgi:glycerol kinase